MRFAFTSLLSVFVADNKQSNRSEGFLSFSRTNPLLPFRSQGKTAERRHSRAQARAAVEEQCRRWHGSLWRYGM